MLLIVIKKQGKRIKEKGREGGRVKTERGKKKERKEGKERKRERGRGGRKEERKREEILPKSSFSNTQPSQFYKRISRRNSLKEQIIPM